MWLLLTCVIFPEVFKPAEHRGDNTSFVVSYPHMEVVEMRNRKKLKN